VGDGLLQVGEGVGVAVGQADVDDWQDDRERFPLDYDRIVW
jgi:hypothetical protein